MCIRDSLYTLSGMDAIDGGTVSFCRRDLAACREEELADLRRTRMGFVFQQPALLKNLNLLDNIIFPSLRSHGRNGAEAEEKAKALMAVSYPHLDVYKRQLFLPPKT